MEPLVIYCLQGRCHSFSMVSISYRSVEHFAIICEFPSESETSTIADGINYTGDLARYVLDHLFDNLTDKSY